MKHRLSLLLLCWLAAVQGGAQTVVQPSAPPASNKKPAVSSLQTLEGTYVSNLKIVHAPLIQQYMGELKALLDKSPASDAPAIKAEMARVQKMIDGGGLIEYSGKAAAPGGPAMGNGIVFTLEPHEAQPPQPDDNPVPLGEASWTLSRLPAGNYDVIAHYSCETLPVTPVLKITFQGQEYQKELRPSNATRNSTTFRVMKLCQLRIKEDASFQKFTVTAGPGSEPWWFAKQILIVKAKEPK